MATQGLVPSEELGSAARWWLWPACFLLFLMLVLPMALNFLYIKTALFAFLLILVFVQGIRSLRLHPTVVLWTLVLAAAGLFFGLRGLMFGTPGALNSIQLFVFWPLVYLFLLSGVRSVRTLQALERTLLFSSASVALFLLLYVASQAHAIPEIPGTSLLFTRNELEGGYFLSASFLDGHMTLGFPGIHSYAFLIPFLIAALIDRSFSRSKAWTGRWWCALSLLLSLPVVFLSGRRAVQIVTMLAPPMTLAVGLFYPKPEKKLLIKSFTRTSSLLVIGAVLSFAVLALTNLVTLEGLEERFSTGFDFSASNRSDSALGRIDQYLGLMDGWEQSPYLGQGLGATAHRSVRSPDFPWIYELSYVDLLFQTGLIGCALYFAGIVWIYWSGLNIIRSGGEPARFMLPVLVGLSGMLIANATNPYLTRFDALWAIFLPVGFINHRLLVRYRRPSVLEPIPEHG